MRQPPAIHIREVTPRDGLQAEPRIVATSDKVALTEMLVDAGFTHVNVTSFVSPTAVPQMADGAEVLQRVRRRPGVVLDVSVPNAKGAARAVEAGVDAVSVFVSASDEASRKNVRRGREEALAGVLEAVSVAVDGGLPVIGTIANAFGSPYGDTVSLDVVLQIAGRLVDQGVSSVTLGDTSGEAVPPQILKWVSALTAEYPELPVALHLHDSRGSALANTVAAMDAGVTRFDSAMGGLGGSPYTKDASGNLCTEDLISLCERSGIATGVRLQDAVRISRFCAELVGRELPGRTARLGAEPQPSAGVSS
ncbi:hydroxymethylglutaryl-CoA lyase [Nocardioides humi]|uniref:Hydroxymethylglutaryl-CoA lyase n=2 Tax=Nocardioides humi TaxID=449461 RepID=A0ABN2AED0_9ACTN|nr:hydroxymethylglutaryl-CoA lyase [Nocardioides humi]